MRFEAVSKSVVDVECDVLIVNLFQDATEPGGAAGALDAALGGAIKSMIEREKFEGKIGKVAEVTPSSPVRASRVLVAGLGKMEDFGPEKIRRASGAAMKRARELSAKRVATVLLGAEEAGMEPGVAARALVEGAILGSYQFIKHKTTEAKPNTIEIVEIIEGASESIKSEIRRGQTVAEAVCYARDLVNEPANVVTPTYMADQAQSIAKAIGAECCVVDRAGMKELGLNLVLAVAKGSREEPTFSVIRYTSPGATRTVAIVGKGITFDAGGINLKSGAGLHQMKDDMAGAAAVLATMKAIGTLGSAVNVLAVIPATENLPGGSATKPGDVVLSLSGKSVEINNTDAEGRLLLADGVAYAEMEKADEIIDIATLTGACVVALGRSVAGIVGEQSMVDALIKAGAEGGEKLWQLPMFEDYQDSLKSEIADMTNAPNEAGAITGGMFVKKHIENTPWAHIDIAGPCHTDKDSPLGPKGGTGFGVRTLVNYLMSL